MKRRALDIQIQTTQTDRDVPKHTGAQTTQTPTQTCRNIHTDSRTRKEKKNSRARTRKMLHLCRKAYRNSKIWAENSNAVLFKQIHWGSKTSKIYYINSLRSQASTHCLSNRDTKFSKILPLGGREFSSDSLRCVLLLLSDRVDECSEQELHSPRGLWSAPLPPSAPLASLLRALLVPACGWVGIRDSEWVDGHMHERF